ncbi:MAG: hypothetical protein KZQ80_16055 [Candidatus Thiodiazotropha sp. (ex Monitilora ramsayi)]|nr:hypothetical protein [Candidatus Thiodiazotropha sp. (ex Monitilora ramsayi)]
MVGEKRFGMGPIPTSPEYYLNEKQVSGMAILRKFGWKLVCIRRPSVSEITTVFKNYQENTVGILGEDGILRVSNDLKIRRSSIEST